MATAPTEIDDIRRQMANIRRELHEDVQGVVQGAEAATDWRRYIRNYPWATLGAALVVGYLVVPRKHKSATTIHVAAPTPLAEPARAIANEVGPKARVVEQAVVKESKKRRSWVGAAFGMLAPVIWRSAQGYILKYAEQWLTQKMAAQIQMNPALAAAFGATPEHEPGPPPGMTPPQPPWGRPPQPPGGPRF